MAQSSLPPGFRFHPTDVELCSYYLKRKIMGKKLIVDAIAEVELYKFAPWDLPDKSCLRSRDLEWFFFCPRDKKYPNGSRTNRATPNGYWKTSGKDRTIMLNSRTVGMKKTLIFHEGKAPKGDRTDWVMYEYRMEDDSLVSAGFSKDAYVLCKIFKKSGLGPRIGEQYGAPFNEEEWENAEAETSMFHLLPSSESAHLLPSSEVVNPVEDPLSQQAAPSAMDEPFLQHPSAVCAGEELSFDATANTRIDDTFSDVVAGSNIQDGLVSENNVSNDDIQDGLVSENNVSNDDIQDGLVSENNVSNDVYNVCSPPEFDGFLMEELSHFLNDSPVRDNAYGESCVLPPMSEAEAHAFEVNTLDLYSELAGISGLEDAPSNYTGNDGTMDHTTMPVDRELSTDEFLQLNDLLAPDTTFLSEFPAQNNQVYTFAPYPYNGFYTDVTALPASLEASGSRATMPSVFDGFSPANNGGSASDQATYLSDPSMHYSLP